MDRNKLGIDGSYAQRREVLEPCRRAVPVVAISPSCAERPRGVDHDEYRCRCPLVSSSFECNVCAEKWREYND